MLLINKKLAFTDSWLMCEFVRYWAPQEENTELYWMIRSLWQNNNLSIEDTTLHFCKNIMRYY